VLHERYRMPSRALNTPSATVSSGSAWYFLSLSASKRFRTCRKRITFQKMFAQALRVPSLHACVSGPRHHVKLTWCAF